ncbi:hypothetical protein C5C27_12180 [Rathayibacter sp. AY2B7]|nr:hypothetical protein C5C27_12180 [Rathayibacter sp. AY2B7]
MAGRLRLADRRRRGDGRGRRGDRLPTPRGLGRRLDLRARHLRPPSGIVGRRPAAPVGGHPAHGDREAVTTPPDDESAPTVTLRTGVVRGVRRAGSLAFLGIPFAEPPVGPLRFAAPRRAAPWEEVLDATQLRGESADGSTGGESIDPRGDTGGRRGESDPSAPVPGDRPGRRGCRIDLPE